MTPRLMLRKMLGVAILLMAVGCHPSLKPSSVVADRPLGAVQEIVATEAATQEVATESQGMSDPRYARYQQDWRRMIDRDLAGRDISAADILEAMSRVPRHEFVAPEFSDAAYADRPLPIGQGQTISQPYIVALMTQLVRPQPDDRALDVGTGSGYQAAVLGELVRDVYSIEIVPPLAAEARQRLERLGYKNIHVRAGDGYQGWKERAPFQIIIVAAAPERIPQPLVDQLAPGGRMVIPIGGWDQDLILIEKRADGTIDRTTVAPVAFVPMTGEAQRRR